MHSVQLAAQHAHGVPMLQACGTARLPHHEAESRLVMRTRAEMPADSCLHACGSRGSMPGLEMML